MKNITDLNKTLPVDLQYKTVTFNEFIGRHIGESKPSFDRMVANIKEVKKIEDGFEIQFRNGRWFRVWYNGYMQKSGCKPVRNYNRNNYGEELSIRMNYIDNYTNASVTPEKMIGVCNLILDNELPTTFNKLVVNVMDGSGVKKTADKLGIEFDGHEENLEWTTQTRNFNYHGGLILKLYEITGKVYRFSANDSIIFDAEGTGKYSYLKQYLANKYTVVKEEA